MRIFCQKAGWKEREIIWLDGNSATSDGKRAFSSRKFGQDKWSFARKLVMEVSSQEWGSLVLCIMVGIPILWQDVHVDERSQGISQGIPPLASYCQLTQFGVGNGESVKVWHHYWW